MTENESSTLACLECGQPIAGARRWLCGARCSDVMKLVRYGRRSKAGDVSPIEDDRLRRFRREAAIEGRFPTKAVRRDVLDNDKHRCQLCGAGGAEEVDYRLDIARPRQTVRTDDLRTLCSRCQRSESSRRFVDRRGRIAPTAPATWARIEAAEPLVPRDDQELWSSDAPWGLRRQGFLRSWPLASPEARLDLDRWIQALGDRRPETEGDASGDAPPLEDWLNTALDSLGLPLRRQAHLVRAIHALVFTAQIDQSSRETVREESPHGEGRRTP